MVACSGNSTTTGRESAALAIADQRHTRTSIPKKKLSPNTTVVLPSYDSDPGLKALVFGSFFRRLKPPAPSAIAVCNCGSDPGLKAVVFWPFFRGLKPPAPSAIAVCNCSTKRRKRVDLDVNFRVVCMSIPLPHTTLFALAASELPAGFPSQQYCLVPASGRYRYCCARLAIDAD